MISLQNVTKIYPGSASPALDQITLDIEKGEFVFLVGPSGAGKSTLIKLLFRELLPTKGEIYFFGRNLARLDKKALLNHRRQIGMVFQDFRLLKQKTVFENVAFALEVLGKPPKEIEFKVAEVLEKVGLAGKEKAFPEELSGGEQQRVGVARALVKDPLLLLADEPTGNLDRNTSRQLMELLETLNAEGTTMVIATHAWDLVDRMQKRVISLNQGRLVRDEKRGTYGHEF
ncbi:MAG: cell division ATP-binding protein FtsE [Firmicutes bacterium]|nr:cell division ATP-binding protein FtsE [Bacillota bacterium]